MSDSLQHLLRHHGDFAHFRDVMQQTSAGRFGPIWWGVWDQHVAPIKPSDVLDLGTGPGLLLPMLRQRLPNAGLTAVEVQPEMLEAAAPLARQVGATLVTSDLAQPIPLPDASFDVITAVMVFHELTFPPALLDEMFRLLRPGGRVVLYDWVKRPLSAYLGDAQLDEDKLQHFREHCLFATEDLEFLVERAGMQTVEIVGRRGGNYAIVVAQKPS